MILRFIRCLKLKREIDRKLAARKLLRPERQRAAAKGWETRRART